jgi:hypothetical protein
MNVVESESNTPSALEIKPEEKKSNKYKNITQSNHGTLPMLTDELTSINIDEMLEKEKQHNKIDSWNKLDKTAKLRKLNRFSEVYGRENKMSIKEIKSLQSFFGDCLTKNKLQKKKDVNCDKVSFEIINIPALFFNSINRNFTLKSTDAKRVSTLKSLTPKRIIIPDQDHSKIEVEMEADV